MDSNHNDRIEQMRTLYPEKFASESQVFSRINRGDHIFISTGCGEPQHLVKALVDYVESHPKAFFDAEVFHVWTLGLAPYTDQKFKYNFRHNSFFIAANTREAVNQGLADYTPIFLSQVPDLLRRKMITIDVALIQTSPPDSHGYMSLGLSVDIVKAAIDSASLVIAQVNSNMPRVHGDGFIHIEEADFVIPYDEPLLELKPRPLDDVSIHIGQYVSRIIEDGDTIQVGYGSVPNAVMAALGNHKHLGVHTELISDGIVDLMKKGVIDNSTKNRKRGKTVASFCMGSRSTYEYINDNPAIEFRTIDYTNNPLIIAQHRNMAAINSALEIDLTGQATAESIGRSFYSGIGGQADFMRGSVLAPGGKTILTIPSTARGGTVSRIVPALEAGAGVTLHRSDVHYVVTEYGIAHLHGKNIRERAMDLIAIAHPKYRSWLIEEAKKLRLIHEDQAFIPGEKGEYPENLETYRTTQAGLSVKLRPVRISDEPLVKELFYGLSDQSMYRRFISARKDMPHERLQEFVVVDYSMEMVILAVVEDGELETVVGMGQYLIEEGRHWAEVAMVVRDDYQNKGIGTELLSYLTYLARRQGLLGFTAEVLVENRPMLRLFEKAGFSTQRQSSGETYSLRLAFSTPVTT